MEFAAPAAVRRLVALAGAKSLRQLCCMPALPLLVLTVLCGGAHGDPPADATAAALRKAVTFYASFDEQTTADFGQGDLTLWTRYGEAAKGTTLERHEIDAKRLRIVRAGGASRGALEFLDVIPNDGFVFFRARGKLLVKPGGWGGSMSIWLKCDPSKLKTQYCDPMQIVGRRYNNGAVWTDFTPDRPRDLRLGLFPSLPEGQAGPEKAEKLQPIVRAKAPAIQPGKWHNLLMTWENFDTGRKDARATLYLDGAPIAQLVDQAGQMNWDLDRVRIFLGAALIGMIDEVTIFDHPLSSTEIADVASQPALFAGLK